MMDIIFITRKPQKCAPPLAAGIFPQSQLHLDSMNFIACMVQWCRVASFLSIAILRNVLRESVCVCVCV